MTLSVAGPSITELEIATVLDAVKNGWYGDKAYYYCELFQKEFAALHGRKYALMTPNCTSAIHLSLLSLGIGPGDEVIVPESTWIATAAPISYVGATPIFCDVDDSWCLSPESVKKQITPKTKAIIVVDLYGNMPNMDELQNVADEAGVDLIEDAAEAIGSTYKGIRAGKFGTASVFSFHRTKTLTTGEGGMLLTDDEDVFRRASFLRDHGRSVDASKIFWNDEVAYKYMPFNIQAALGYAQLQRLDELVAKKRAQFDAYRQGLKHIPDLSWNAEPAHVFNSYWMTTLIFGKSHSLNKENVIGRLAKVGVPVRPFFYPLSSLPAYGSKDLRELNPVSYDLSDRGINLPCSAQTTDEEIKLVCQEIEKICTHT